MSMPESTKLVHLRVRDLLRKDNWEVDNFHKMGWKVRSEDNNKWIMIGPDNVRIRNPEHDSSEHDPDDTDYPLWLQPKPVEE